MVYLDEKNNLILVWSFCLFAFFCSAAVVDCDAPLYQLLSCAVVRWWRASKDGRMCWSWGSSCGRIFNSSSIFLRRYCGCLGACWCACLHWCFHLLWALWRMMRALPQPGWCCEDHACGTMLRFINCHSWLLEDWGWSNYKSQKVFCLWPQRLYAIVASERRD